jgi:acylphosphatase
MAEQIVRRHLMVHGLVQGVWFRRATQRTARALGVAGWVRNCADGSVEVVLEGAPERVTAAVAFCHEGPSGARVDHVDTSDEAPEGLTRFELRA